MVKCTKCGKEANYLQAIINIGYTTEIYAFRCKKHLKYEVEKEEKEEQ